MIALSILFLAAYTFCAVGSFAAFKIDKDIFMAVFLALIMLVFGVGGGFAFYNFGFGESLSQNDLEHNSVYGVLSQNKANGKYFAVMAKIGEVEFSKDSKITSWEVEYELEYKFYELETPISQDAGPCFLVIKQGGSMRVVPFVLPNPESWR